MKYFYKSLQLVLMVVVLMACKKLVNDSMDVVPVLKAPLSISVINDDDQLPVVGAKVIISRKISTKDDFAQIDTIRTNQQGQIKLDLPYPNYLKIEVDTTYYHKGEQTLEFTTENGGSVTLHTTPKYGMAPLEIGVTDRTTALPIPDIALSIGVHDPEQTEFISTGSENADAGGKLMVSLPYPKVVRVAVADTMKYFPDTVVVSLKNVKGATVALKTELKPLTVPLEVTVLDKDDSKPLADIDIAVLQKLTGETDFKDIGLLGTTDANGKVIINAPFSGEVKIKTADPLYSLAAEVNTRLAYEKNRKVTLLTKALIPTSPIEISVYDQVNSQILPGISVKVSYKRTGQTTFTEVTTASTNEEGKLSVGIPFSGEMKFEVINDSYFANKSITAQNIGSAAKTVALPLALNTAQYPEPIITDLQVGTIKLNNAITLASPTDVAMDKRGNIYICDQNNNRIVRVSKTGNTTVLAGSGTAGTANGTGTSATFNKPWGLALDDAGTTLYVSDNSGHKVRKVSIAPATMVAIVTTIAGSGTAGTLDADGTAATLNRPSGLALDEAAGILYVGDYGGNRIRKIELNSNNKVTTVSTSVVYAPVALALNSAKTQLYVGAFGNTFGSTGSQLIKFTPAGARTGLKGILDNNYNNPSGLFISQAGKVFIANDQAHMISQLATEVGASGSGNGTSTFSYLAGSATFTTTVTNGVTGDPGNIDGPAATARFTSPWGIKYNTYTGAFIIADQGNNSIRIMKSSTIQ
jgi:5-hydroxyisourate hydrolase-like protein (transthyretin family)